MANVALVSPPFISDYMRNARCDFVSLSKSSWFPIWLGQAGSYVESRGHTTRLMDAQVAGWSKERTLDEIRRFKADVVAVYTGRLSEESDVAFGDAVKALGPEVVFVGPYTSVDPAKLLAKASRVRLAIKKEFDLPLEELASGADPRTTPNVTVKSDSGEITATSPRPLYKTEILDTFPLTAEYFHRQLDVARYKTPSELYPFVDVMSGRGCAWGRCNFCLWVQSFVDGSVYNLRSIEHFLAEFDYIHRFMPEVKGVMIQDDMLTNKRAQEIANGLLGRSYPIRWSCYAKPNSRLSLETLKLMRRSGCLNLHVGFESGDDEVLGLIDKGSTVAQAKEFAALAHQADLQIHGDFAMGHYGETMESMRRTIALAKEINPHTAQFQIMIPFDGTTFMDQLQGECSMSASGEPSYEARGGPSAEEIRSMAKRAYREFYISRAYVKKVVSNPRDYFFPRLDQYARAIPAMTWGRWIK